LIKAKKNFDRISTLRKSQSVAQNEMERAVEMRDVAEANLKRALASKTEAERIADKTEAALRYYESRLTNTRIVAPFDGLVVCRNRNPGDVVIPGGSIMDIISTERIWASVWVDETVLGSLSVGQPAKIVFRSASNVAVEGKVARLGLETDRETREFLVDIDIMKLPEKWAIGQRVEAYIETGRKNNAIFVPQRFIVRRNGKTGVIIDQNGKAKWQPVKTGLRGRNTIEIIDGLTSGEVVITAQPGKEMPRDGRMIRYKQ
jgi:RND family efflux transporter MFP subunit